jgi:uncharacterized protein (DUF2252 family)
VLDSFMGKQRPSSQSSDHFDRTLTPAEAQAARLPTLHRRRELKMARDPHAYVRGSTERFYDWLSTRDGREIPQGPTVWICGDAHVGNLGPIARCDERVVVELRDLDQSTRGNPAHDLIRLALSLAMAARSSVLPGVVTALLMEELMSGYIEGFAAPHEQSVPTSSAAVRFVVREALRRKWRHLHRERLGKLPQFPTGNRFLPLVDEERASVEAFLDRERVRRLVTRLECRDDNAKIRLIDAAYWVKGCSSLGLWRCAALVEVLGHEHKRGGYSLLDIKQAVRPFAPWAGDEPVAAHQGERVAKGTAALSPALGKRTLSGTILDYEVFVRELLPQDLKVELGMLNETEARATARALAQVVGLGHARQMDAADRASWVRDLEMASTRALDAPSWLWTSVVELIGTHERAYLAHCRLHALAAEKARLQAAG